MIKNDFKYLLVFVLCSSMYVLAENSIDFNYLLKSVGNDKSDDLRILALRVEFETDSLSYTSGSGKFNSEYPDTMLIDAMPHDKAYFEDQLEFVKNYFEAESDGKTSVSEINVLDTIVTLTHPIWYYNPNNGDEALAERLKELYSDSWSQIAQDTSIEFSEYDTFVIFHAGSGQEFNPGYDETPFDIPSVFLSSNDLGGTVITAHDGTEIDNSVILPECEWQIFDGNWYHAGMSGISCLMFAHRIGIPNMYSSANGKSCIGRFGLMDQGSANFSGMLPAGVTAWVKELKGWEEISEINSPQSGISAVADSAVFKLDLNSDEYLLIENVTAKNPSLTENSSLTGYDRDGKRIRFYYDENGYQKIEVVDPGFKTLVEVQDDDFNFGVPARGILVWHIDKRKTTAYNIENNLINDDYDHRGVYIEEGDGSFDIGKDYWLLDNGYGTEFGWEFDAFFSNNEIWLDYANTSLNKVEFSSLSYPRADTNEGIQTGIKLHDFSTIGREMFFSYSYEEPELNFSLDPKLGRSVYLPAYTDDGFPNTAGDLRHFFAGRSGLYKIFDKDSLLFSGSFGDSVSMNILPVQIKNRVIAINSDSTAVFAADISTGTFNRIEISGKIVSQPADRIIPSQNGIYLLRDDMTTENISAEFRNAQKLSVLNDLGGIPVYIAGENNSVFFTIDLSREPFEVETRILPQDSINHHFILTNSTRVMRKAKIFSYSTGDDTVRLGWNDTDYDSKLESITSSGTVLSVRSENEVYENGFPVQTGLGTISATLIFKDYMYNKFNIVAIDSSSNYAVISSDGQLGNTGIRTMNGFGKNSGLLVINNSLSGSICLYNHNENGILTYHKIIGGSGNIVDYLDRIKGVSVIEENIMPTTTILSKSVYNWPNPARGDETNFRFYLNIPSEVLIDIYDINGNKVETLKQNLISGREYSEIIWNIKNTPSGIYNAFLSFRSGSQEEKRKVKVAVIK